SQAGVEGRGLGGVRFEAAAPLVTTFTTPRGTRISPLRQLRPIPKVGGDVEPREDSIARLAGPAPDPPMFHPVINGWHIRMPLGLCEIAKPLNLSRVQI